MPRLTTKTITKPSESLRNWPVPPPYIYNEELKRRNFEKLYFSKWSEPVIDSSLITVEEENLLFRQLNYCGYKTSIMYQSANTGKKVSIHKYMQWIDKYNKIREKITNANIGLVYKLIERYDNIKNKDDMLGEGFFALLRAIDTFNVWKGYRFSTYACNSILHSFIREYKKEYRHSEMYSWDPDFEIPQDDIRDQSPFYVERLRNVINCDNLLTDVERLVISSRFPRDGSKKITLLDLGKVLGYSQEHIRNVQTKAIEKIRGVLIKDPMLV